MLHEDRRRAGSFGDDAEQYDRSRPAYPSNLIDHVLRDRPKLVLDAGCGTGIASRLLVARGCQVVGVEPDGRMAAVARRRGLAVEEGNFEDWDPAGRHFDLLVSAQAWHWVDPVRGAIKARVALRSGALAAMFWNRGQPPDDLRVALDRAYQRVAPEMGRGYALPSAANREPDEDCQIAADALEKNGGFTDVVIRSFSQSVRYTTAQWLDQLPTHSDHRVLPAQRRAEVLAAVGETIDRFGGQFEMFYATWLVEAQKTG